MEVGRLPLSASQRGKLISAGYTTLASLSSISPSDLARDLKVPESEAFEMLKVAKLGCGLEQPDKHTAIVNGAQTAWDILNEEKLLPRITTSCADLDKILGGGINCKEVTEIGGVPGIGKTQLGIQLAVNVQIPVDCGGLGGKAVYIDTEGSFMVERTLQIAEASVVNWSSYSELLWKESQACRVEIQPTDILEKIYYFRICTSTEQIALINYLDQFISEHKDESITWWNGLKVDEPWKKVQSGGCHIQSSND
ncbi:DNA repair protein RAD51 homolog 3 isoform X2 [Rosa rugosa]|uniref:DNA repair protein RAD51 homolog 3 isoform X2 n=1 Tax=Rosa rugosa TaxID=74645 RepID=UPI002B402C4A|nr:DNA repair protein RAD51 homolog 3 isoform X2 [Rosa rugosa]